MSAQLGFCTDMMHLAFSQVVELDLRVLVGDLLPLHFHRLPGPEPAMFGC